MVHTKSLTQTPTHPNNQLTDQNTKSVAENNNHRINLRLEYKLDSANTIYLIPSINFQDNKSFGFSSTESYYGVNDTSSTSKNDNRADRNGFNIRNSLMFRHAFHKRGRSLSFGLNTNYTQNDGDSYIDAKYRFFDGQMVTDSLQNQHYDNTTDGHSIEAILPIRSRSGKKASCRLTTPQPFKEQCRPANVFI
jgi:hypothetical protein